jgi:CheY-like chemotaxis protein
VESHGKLVTILIADDDSDDRLLMKRLLKQSRLYNDLRFVEDGEALLDYLYQRGPYSAAGAAPRPGLILLDLNMPKISGREALAEIKTDPNLRTIPIVVLTTSKAQQEIYRSYDLGANSFITKPVNFEAMVEIMRAVTSYWFSIVELPSDTNGD